MSIRYILLVFITAFAGRCLWGQTQTLGDALRANAVPVEIVSGAEQRGKITSFAVSGSGSPFLIAYYDDDGSGLLRPLLHVIRYDRETKASRQVEIRGVEGSAHGFDGVMARPSESCMGSALGISELDGLVVISTHINPSAGCALILTQDLKFRAGLWGWVVGRVDGQLIIEGDTIHFAPTHPVDLKVYDSRANRLTQIYPMSGDARREAFTHRLQQTLTTSEWCRENNNGCDPARFTTVFSKIVVDERDTSFNFDVIMSSDGFGDRAEQIVGSETVSYICRFRNGSWVLTLK